ncbi:histone acetyltransferase [Paenibacillus sp. TCA20]|uniref:GNAT family N-acetyltransferase n=1 Tax=Paenibacillus urinalis TaxID=521520 RepID=A0AAX3N5G3_9BACL|nr:MULTISPECIES: GNAT family N-acetyltransferase [Paenibacillus]WDH83970.1 GNAT family N-acetyltransferase [Paenibacillus urinalis]GAK40903.1 histone acetyltransferase [Paenibacillus sp. TCA20]
MNYRIRPIEAEDVAFLWDMLYESLYVPEGQEPFNREIINDPHLSKYVEGWGRNGDFGFIAMDEQDKPVGSITARYFHESNKGFGYVDNDVPELGMAILAEYRGIGIGSALMNKLFQEARKKNIERISLSVDPHNEAAMKLYQRFCFKETGKVGTSITMVANIIK